MTPTTFQAALACVNGAQSGSFSATGANNSYSGTFTFGNQAGAFDGDQTLERHKGAGVTSPGWSVMAWASGREKALDPLAAFLCGGRSASWFPSRRGSRR